jgi:hypothetical protein
MRLILRGVLFVLAFSLGLNALAQDTEKPKEKPKKEKKEKPLKKKELTQFVDPFIGTGGHGHT